MKRLIILGIQGAVIIDQEVNVVGGDFSWVADAPILCQSMFLCEPPEDEEEQL